MADLFATFLGMQPMLHVFAQHVIEFDLPHRLVTSVALEFWALEVCEACQDRMLPSSVPALLRSYVPVNQSRPLLLSLVLASRACITGSAKIR